MTDESLLSRLVALKTTPMRDLKAMWRDLFKSDPPAYNRAFLESRLAYHLQELAHGGLAVTTVSRLEKMADDTDDSSKSNSGRGDGLPIAGTQLLREWKGVEHCITVREDGFEYLGRPFKSLSAAARAITGSHWNGHTFFGVKSRRKKT